MVGEYVADIVVESRVIVEIKTVENIDRVHEVNFKHPKADIKKMVLNLPEGHDD